MKKIYTLLLSSIVFISGSSIATAQKPMLGVRLGANMYQNVGNAIENKYSGFVVGGAYAGLRFERTSFSVEANFTQTQTVAGDNFNDVYKDYFQAGKQMIQHSRFNFTELSIPVLLGKRIFNPVWLQIGPQFTSVVNIQDKDEVLTEAESVFKNGYVSGVVGLNIYLPLKFQLTGRYILGLSNRNNTHVDEKWSTQHVQLSLAWGF